jgi:hypothetical protein
MPFLVESPDGTEKQVVPSLSGYEGWTVLEEDIPAPKGHAVRSEGKWERTEDKEEERLAKMTGRALVEAIERPLAARIVQLETDVNTLKSALDDLRGRLQLLEAPQAGKRG